MFFKHALQQYIDHPEKYEDLLVHNDSEVVIIRDLYPKALRHYLIIPKSPKLTHIHPLEVFQKNVELYAKISEYVEQCKDIIVQDLKESNYLNKMDTLQVGEFKNTFIKAGVHSVPSLSNLHIHVITKDFHSSRLKNKKHYNSFNTLFFVNFEDLEPISLDSANSSGSGTDYGSDYTTDEELSRFEPDSRANESIIKNTPLSCSYCSKNFGSSFQALKAHLDEEFSIKFSSEFAK